MKFHTVLFLCAAACSGTTALDTEPLCSTASEEPPIGLEDTSSLGFSAADILAVLDGTISVTAADLDEQPVEIHEITYAFTSDNTARVQDLISRFPGPSLCVTGKTLSLEATLEVTADDWLVGAGPVQILAQEVDDEHIWLHGTFDVDPEDSLEEIAFEDNAQRYADASCGDEDVRVRFGVVNQPDEPWAVNKGTVSYHTCAGAANLYHLEPAAP